MSAHAKANVHQVAKEGFEKQTDSYDLARPGYPPQALDDVINLISLKDGAKVLDLACGTGKFTQSLVNHSVALDIVACEPAASMRAKFSENFPDIECVDATSTALPYADESFDLVAVAQAFHWFANVESLAEINRVLKPGAHLLLIWNLEDRQGAQWLAELRDLYEAHEAGSPQYRLGLHKQVWQTPEAKQLFGPVKTIDYSHHLMNTRDQIWSRVLSKSYIARKTQEEQEELEKQAREIFDRHLGSSETERAQLVHCPFECNVELAQKQ